MGLASRQRLLENIQTRSGDFGQARHGEEVLVLALDPKQPEFLIRSGLYTDLGGGDGREDEGQVQRGMGNDQFLDHKHGNKGNLVSQGEVPKTFQLLARKASSEAKGNKGSPNSPPLPEPASMGQILGKLNFEVKKN